MRVMKILFDNTPTFKDEIKKMEIETTVTTEEAAAAVVRFESTLRELNQIIQKRKIEESIITIIPSTQQ